MKKKELMPCPCCRATTCIMNKSCLGCETYSEWLRKETILRKLEKTWTVNNDTR